MIGKHAYMQEEKLQKRKLRKIILFIIAVSLLISGSFLLLSTYSETLRKSYSAADTENADRLNQDAALTGRSVLYLSSYTDAFETVPAQEKGLSEIFRSYDIHLDYEFMDTKNHSSDAYMSLFYKLLSYKLSDHKTYDAVILADDAALSFAVKYQDVLFKNIPMVFFGINNIKNAQEAAANPYITGSTEQINLKETLQIAVKLLPSASRIVSILDDTETGLGDREQFNAVKTEFPGYHFEVLDASKMTRSGLASAVSRLDKNCILVYQDAFTDSDGNPYTMTDTIRMLNINAEIPVFRTYASGVGEGILGGYLFDFTIAGNQAAETVVKVLSGTDISTIPLTTTGLSHFIVDYQQLKKYNLDPSVLPENTMFINKPVGYYETYGKVLLPFIFLLMGMLLFTIIYYLDYRQSEKYAEQLRVSADNLEYLTEHDYLTHLCNRRAASEYLADSLRREKQCTVLMLDIDNFKELNDTYGHTCGDHILIEIAKRLQLLSEKMQGMTARFGGDEFLVILEDKILGKDSQELLYMEKLLSTEFYYEKHLVPVTGSIGIAVHDRETITAEKLLSNADQALNQAKLLGKNTSIFYDKSLRENIKRRNEISVQLVAACQNHGFRVLYQPQIDTATGGVCGFEALLRMGRTDLSPAEFIPVAEKTGIIVRIGRIVTEMVVAQMAFWHDKGMKPVNVSINYSCEQLKDDGYVEYLKTLLERYNVPGSLITIEITESLFLDSTDKAMKLFSAFKELGVQIALDDFGTGYSSLRYLTYIPVDEIKLDKTIVDTYLKKGKESFIGNLVNLSHGLNMKFVVEGIEQEWQRDMAIALGCDKIQGYYYSRPVTAEEAAVFKAG